VRQEWNGGLGILFPSDEDGSNSQGARIRTVWDREDEPVTQSASCQRRLLPWGLDFADTLLTITSFACRPVTAPYHTVVSRMAQRAAGLQYRYAENDAEGALFDTLSALCAAWVTLCSYVFTPVYGFFPPPSFAPLTALAGCSLRMSERVTATLPLHITCRKEEAGSKQGLSLTLPESVEQPEMGEYRCFSRLLARAMADPAVALLQSSSPRWRSSSSRGNTSRPQAVSSPRRSLSDPRASPSSDAASRRTAAGCGATPSKGLPFAPSLSLACTCIRSRSHRLTVVLHPNLHLDGPVSAPDRSLTLCKGRCEYKQRISSYSGCPQI
jgi:hypothetical protein